MGDYKIYDEDSGRIFNVTEGLRHTVIVRFTDGAAGAWSTPASRVLFSPRYAGKIVSIAFIPDTDITGHDTTNSTLTFTNTLQNGAGTGVVLAFEFTDPEGTVGDFTKLDLGAVSATHGIMAAGDVITIAKTVKDTGIDLKDFVIAIDYEISEAR